ncbi:MAG: S8 family serine peptidase [candidate division WOR-3 bacterium]
MNILLTILIFFNTPFYRPPIKQQLPKVDNNLVWVYFTDKGFRTESEYYQIINNYTPYLSEDAIQRRLNYTGKVFDFDDLPVYQKYVDEIVNLGAELRTVSYWLNAASFKISPALVERIYNLPFVYNLTAVASDTQYLVDGINILDSDKRSKKPDTSFYGLTYQQNAMMGVPSVFFQGYTGSRVKLAIFDTGLKRKHSALTHLKVFQEHDFLSGDNFFQYRNNLVEPISNLRNINLTQSPQFFQTANNRLFIFYAGDTLLNLSGPVYKGLFYSYSLNQGQTWSTPQLTFLTTTYNMAIPTVSISGKDSVLYVAWQDLLPQAPNLPITRLYLKYFINTTPSTVTTDLGFGKNPNLTVKDTNLYIVYTNSDSNLYFRKASVYYITPVLYPTPMLIASLSEPIISPCVIVDSMGEIEVFATGQHSQKIFHYNSGDNGNTFNLQPIVDSFAGTIKSQGIGNTIYLVYKDYSSAPFVKLSFRKSTNGGLSWSDKKTVTSDLFSLGDFSIAVNDTIYITYEMQGDIYLTKSADFGNSWFDPVVIADKFCYLPRINIVNNQPLVMWIQRGDGNTDYDSLQDYKEQPNHGTRMASIIAGYRPYALIGTSPGVDLLVAKTELYKAKSGWQYETITEEDIWVQALEWAERQGVQIISSSLGYRSWYVDKDFDGKTIPISIAAGLAAKRGVIVVSAMGNRDTINFPWPTRYIVAPGDAEGIITAGGVTKSFLPWRGTGIGPTYDGRIKPELVALAETAIVVAPDSFDSYEGSIGTSCATALIAGCCAVILEAHPEWNADSVKFALFTTASNNIPNCTLGYGVPNIDSLFKVFPPRRTAYESDQLGSPYPNPLITREQGRIYFPLLLMRKPASAQIKIYTITGELVKTLNLNTTHLPGPGRYGVDGDITELENIGAYWNGENELGKKVSSGLYFAVLKTSFGQHLKKFAIVQ